MLEHRRRELRPPPPAIHWKRTPYLDSVCPEVRTDAKSTTASSIRPLEQHTADATSIFSADAASIFFKSDGRPQLPADCSHLGAPLRLYSFSLQSILRIHASTAGFACARLRAVPPSSAPPSHLPASPPRRPARGPEHPNAASLRRPRCLPSYASSLRHPHHPNDLTWCHTHRRRIWTPPSSPRPELASPILAAVGARMHQGWSLGDRQTHAMPRPPDPRHSHVSRGLWARVFSPSGEAAGSSSSPLPVIVYAHGGGFVLLSTASTPLDGMCHRFCRELGVVVVSVDYRLAPEHRCPAAYDDVVDVLHYLSTTGLPSDLSVPPIDLSCCFLAGDSTGGNIAHHVAQRWTASFSSSSPPSSNPIRLAGVILLQPYFGSEERTESELRLEGVAPLVNIRRSDWSWRAFLPEGPTGGEHPARCYFNLKMAITSLLKLE